MDLSEYFFFSSRRRHTIYWRDWSSDVCSSDLPAVLFALLIGLGAGLGEETLFRGAVQPVLGILGTSVLFASMHIQYGPSLLLVHVFLLSVGLGLLRRYINTTARDRKSVV